MTTVFLSGSRKISHINELIRGRLDNMMNNNLDIMVGDANGADKAMQSYLAEKEYPKVTVYFVGSKCRNNVGNWETRNVQVDSKLSGRQFYSHKDKKMAQIADFGFVLWDGQSAGSIENVFEVVKHGKKAVVYFTPEKWFSNIKSIADIQALLGECDREVLRNLDRKLNFNRMYREIENRLQETIQFQ